MRQIRTSGSTSGVWKRSMARLPKGPETARLGLNHLAMAPPRRRGCRRADITSFLETLQLWRPKPLEKVRSTFIGHVLIGSTFSWSDSPHYVAGCLLTVLLVSFLKAIARCERQP